MSKNKQILIFSAIGLAVLGGVTAVLLLTAPEKPVENDDNIVAEEPKDERLYLTDKKTEDVVSIHVKNLSDEYDIVRDGEDWTIKGIEGASILTDSLEALAENVSAMTAERVVEENVSDLSKYGLSAPEYTVTVDYGDEQFVFCGGNETPTSSSEIYLCENGGATVYTYKKSRLSGFAGDKYSFVSTAAMPAYDQSTGEMVTKFTIDRVDLEKPIVIETIPAPDEDEIAVFSYELTSPYNAYVDLTNAPNFIYSLFGLTAQKAVWYGMEETDYEVSGVNNPNCVFTLETNVKTYTITLGNAVAEEVADENGNVTTQIAGFYGISSEVPDTLFLFSADDIPAFSIQAEALISRLFLMPYIYSLESVEYSDCKGQSFEIGFETIKGAGEDGADVHNHYLNGELHDEQQIKNMYQYLIGASGDETYFDEAKGELLAEVKYNYADDAEASDVVQFYSSDEDRSVIINVNGHNLFKTKQIYINQLYSNAESFLNGGEIILTY